MGKSPQQKAFDVSLNAEKRKNFSLWLCDELDKAAAARSTPLEEVRYWWTLYEQGRTREQTSPWQDAADLTSYLSTEKVDALRSRIMRTIFVEPMYTVEGWGKSAAKAPFVEEFHQWAMESEGLQPALGRAIHASLIEPRGVLEVFEDTTERVTRRNIRAAVSVVPDGMGGMTWQMDGETNEPVLQKDEYGNYVEVTDPNQPAADTVIDEVQRVRKGPSYRVLPYEHFLVLPSHAREKADIWGYAKRFTRRIDQLQEAVKGGIYDKQAVEDIHTEPDVVSEMTPSGGNIPVASQDGPLAEKELHEVQLLHNLDGKGLRWYVATVHIPTRTLLRLKYDDVDMGRFIIFTPFPRTDRAHEGYSFVGHKLITTTEEHTAWRNMIADRAANVIAAPIKRLTTALWDPQLQPMGPKAVIDVRDMNEIQAMDMPDLTGPAIQREQEIVQASERIAGMNDVVLTGSDSTGDSTLGEFNTRQEAVAVRMDEVVKCLQEALEDLGQVRNAIWVKTLRDCEKYGGMSAPQYLFEGLDEKGGDPSKGMAGEMTVQSTMLEGTFRFKPRGSTETADKGRLRSDYFQGLQALALLFKIWPALMMTVGQNPQAAKSAIEQWLRLFNIPDKQAWLGNIEQMMQVDPMTGQPVMPMGPPGAPPGAGGPPGMPPGMPPQIAAMLGGGGPQMGANG